MFAAVFCVFVCFFVLFRLLVSHLVILSKLLPLTKNNAFTVLGVAYGTGPRRSIARSCQGPSGSVVDINCSCGFGRATN